MTARDLLQIARKRTNGCQLMLDLSGDSKGSSVDRLVCIRPVLKENCIHFCFDNSLIRKNDCALWVKLLQRLMAVLGTDVHASIGSVDLLNDTERNWQFISKDRLPLPVSFVSIIEQFVAVASRYSQRVAVHSEQEQVTYRELQSAVATLVNAFHGKGVKKGDVIGIGTFRDINYIAGVLATLACGAVYLPLDLTQPKDRIDAVLKEANARFVLAYDADSPHSLPAPIQQLNFSSLETVDLPSPVKITPVSPTDAAYIIFTSGSTGVPKGTVVSHGSFSWFIGEDVSFHEITENDRVLQVCGLSFDASVEEMFSALTTGASLYFRPENLLMSMKQYFDYCRKNQLTIVGLFPSDISEVLSLMGKGELFPPSIRLITTGGESVQKKDIQNWQSVFSKGVKPVPRLVNVYGLTETTVACTMCDLTDHLLPSDNVSIGRPITGTVIHIVDRHMQPLPAGVLGEICIGGMGLADGYISQPALTRQWY